MERRFLSPDDFPEERESDSYDAISTHCAVLDRAGQVSGTLRLVPDSEQGFPLESHAERLDDTFYLIPRDRAAEISRLVLTKDGRRMTDVAQLRPHPAVLFNLFRKMNAESVRLGLEYWLAAMEPSLHRLLRRLLGFEFVQIGDAMNYYGEVRPYMARIEHVAETLQHRRPDLYDYFGFEAFRFGRRSADRRSAPCGRTPLMPTGTSPR